ncbi:calcium-translocating P-type ATPase, PMCA-type [Butyricicoccus pullicaecorum]|uniref:P-type Ca(2+) transporter n=1 Tax=Butyricicoccus pullicaecorum 1.2 TaxID=1203606 RepID=R8VS71_9FIRM|nr:calcium-translocating P-type ATPase, PMCA-type [Butyricicoccus pullicaecorum]EOQ35610.1 calcium-translocating P-type ATPase, PMCA-type [Butyricicoccus pullicaecorum 1.2]SKA66898.1 plasma-membrane calcium-translocating P-type ATPase [Butyricicoccus pullicaecorum DSM 23266]
MHKKLNGLTAAEVEESRKKHGANSIPEAEPETFWQLFLEGFQDPMIRILCVIAVIMFGMFLVGESDWYEPVGTIIAILLVNFVSARTGVANDRAYRDLKASQKKDTVKVLRESVIKVIPADEVVVGDVILLQSGDKILADGILAEGALSVDNSALNGEAEECPKSEAPDGFAIPETITGDTFVDAHSLFRGATVLDGEGYMIVQKVGLDTMMGKMAKDMEDKEPDSPLKVKLNKLAGQISVFGYIGAIIIALAYFVHFVMLAGGLSAYLATGGLSILGDVMNAIAIAITIIVCAVPEGLPLVIALVLMQNTGKLLKVNVLVRKSIGIETAGSLNILFSDKTGTITKGQLEVVEFFDGCGRTTDINTAAAMREALHLSIGKNTGALFDDQHHVVGGNMTDQALLKFLGEEAFHALAARDDCEIGAQQDFNSANKFSQAYLPGQGRTFYKGAPERLLAKAKKCLDTQGNEVDIDETALGQKIDDLANRAMRVLAFGYSREKLVRDEIHDDLVLIGLVGIRDDVRPEAREAIEEVQKAGIQVVMITGDRRETAMAIAREANLYHGGDELVLTSAELAEMSDDEVKKIIPRIRVISRALPTDKSRMVRLCQEMNLVVGMTGDGVNDSPALKRADVGFAMGSGTEVAKEAGKLVILDDNFNSIKNAIWYGRTLYINILKFCKMQLVINLAAVFVSAISPFIGIESPLKVTHLLWINLCMDSLASLMFAGEPALKKYMRMKPRRRDESIISRPMAIQIVIMSIWLTILSLVWFKVPFFRACFATEAQWYTGFFCMFVFAFMVNAFNVRSDSLNVFEHIGENKRFIHIWLAIMAVQVLLVSIGGVIGEIFSCVRFGLDGWIAVCLMALTMYPVDLIRKVLTPKPKA